MDDSAESVSGGFAGPGGGHTVSYWPATEWRTSTPREQGIDEGSLSSMLRHIQQQQTNLNSILIVRNGYLVTEIYFEPHRHDAMHNIASATKSVVSILVGLALRQGFLEDINQPIGAYFPEHATAGAQSPLARVTLAHLLTMTSGLDWHESNLGYDSKRNTLSQMMREQRWVDFILSRRLVDEPGRRFEYSSAASHLLSAILERQTGMTTAAFAREHLFEPLGITDFRWPGDPEGVTLGGWGLHLTPRAMARLGYLYLAQGCWDGDDVVSAEWVRRSTSARVDVARRSSLKARLQRRVNLIRGRPSQRIELKFGYHWWIPWFGGYAARGFAGQAIFVLPRRQLVVVFTGGLPRSEAFLPEWLMQRFILPAIDAGSSASPRAEAADEFAATVKQDIRSTPTPPEPLPEIAGVLSGREYRFARNPAGLESFSLTFQNENEARLALSQRGASYEALVGLDDTFRETRIQDDETLAMRGHWSDPTTFIVDSRSMSTGDRHEMRFVFSDDRVKVYSYGVVENRPSKLEGRRAD